MVLKRSLYKRNSTFIKQIYEPLQKCIKNASPKVDDKSGPLRVERLLGSNKILSHTLQHNKIHYSNFHLMRVLNTITHSTMERDRLMGDMWRPPPRTRIKQNHKTELRIHRENIIFGRRLHEIRYGSCKEIEKSKVKASKDQIGKLPILILQKYKGKVSIPQDPRMQYKLFRPCIYFDLSAVNERHIGCFTFQLYTEACPMVVLGLIRFFMNNNNKDLRFPYIFPTLWAELEIPIDESQFSQVDKLEYDMGALDNASGSGIISFDVGNLKYLKAGVLNLAISFKPLPVVNGKRVAIGRILYGRKNFSILSEYGRKNGKTYKRIVATQLGVVDNEVCR